MLMSAKNKKQKKFLHIFESYLLRLMSVQIFSFIRLVDEKSTCKGNFRRRDRVISPSPLRETNADKKACEE